MKKAGMFPATFPPNWWARSGRPSRATIASRNWRNNTRNWWWKRPVPKEKRDQKKGPTPELLLAQDQEIQQLMARFQAGEPNGVAVQQLEALVRTAIFKPANALVGWLLQQAADRIDAAYQPKPGEAYKGRESIQAQGMFGAFPLSRRYYYHAGKKEGHYPVDNALGLEVSYTPALAKLICLEGADEQTYLKAERHLASTGGIAVSARQ